MRWIPRICAVIGLVAQSNVSPFEVYTLVPALVSASQASKHATKAFSATDFFATCETSSACDLPPAKLNAHVVVVAMAVMANVKRFFAMVNY